VEALALLQRAASAGLRIAELNGELVVRGPRSEVELVEKLRAAKQQVLLALRVGVQDEQPAEPSSWVDIDGVLYSPAAADLFRRSLPFSAEPIPRCGGCGGERMWRLRDGCPWVCARCHPTDLAEAKVEWREGGPPALRPDPKATPPSAPASLTLNPGVAHE
jgi:hypothetical protein